MRTPVARLDIDVVYRALLVRQPWLALLSTAGQLSPQLPGARFSSLQGPNETALRNRLHNRSPATRAEDEEALLQTGDRLKDALEDKFCSGLGDAATVLIIDTVEELSLHYPAVLGNLLDMAPPRSPALPRPAGRAFRPLSGVRSGARASRLVRRGARTAGTRECGEPLLIGPMNEGESVRYLTEVRRIRKEQPLDDIVRVAKGNPFAHALFADLASARTLSAEEGITVVEAIAGTRRARARIAASARPTWCRPAGAPATCWRS
jgi:hypothetical protein